MNASSVPWDTNSRSLVQTLSKPSGHTTTNTYDAAQQLSQVVDGFATTTLTYDQNGRLVESNDNAYGQSRTVTRTYDNLGRLTSYTDENGNTIGYVYDKVGNLTQLSYPDNKIVTYAHDQNNRLWTVTDWAGRQTVYIYDNNGRLVQTIYPDKTQETRSYDTSGKLIAISHQDAGGNVIYSCANTIDAAGRITQEAVYPAPGLTAPASVAVTFDADNQLATYNGQAVTFDSDGNMISGPAAGSSGNASFS